MLIIVGIALVGVVVIIGVVCRIIRFVLVCIVIQLRMKVSVSRYSVTFSRVFVLPSAFVEHLIYCFDVAIK